MCARGSRHVVDVSCAGLKCSFQTVPLDDNKLDPLCDLVDWGGLALIRNDGDCVNPAPKPELLNLEDDAGVTSRLVPTKCCSEWL